MVRVACFQKQSKTSGWNNLDLKETLSFIANCEKRTDVIGDNETNFVSLFDNIVKKYDNNTNGNSSDMPKYSFLFLSDYIDSPAKSAKKTKHTDIENKITEFYNKPNYASYIFFESKNRAQIGQTETDILPILREHLDSGETSFVPLIEGEFDLFDINSKEIPIPIYYENTYTTKELKTNITFNNLNQPFTYSLSLQKEPHIPRSYQHQFYFYDSNDKENIRQVFPKKVKVDNTTTLTLSFSGRILNQFPCHSLVFYSNEKRGYCRFDIVFFKDFSLISKYIISIFILVLYFCLISFIFYLLNEESSPTCLYLEVKKDSKQDFKDGETPKQEENNKQEGVVPEPVNPSI